MSTMLVAELSADLEQDRRLALRRYGALLAADAAGGGEREEAVRELKTLMRGLGKSEADVAADARVVRQAAGMARRFAARAADQDAREQAAQATLDAYDAETAELMKTRRVEYFRLYHALRDLQQTSTEASAAHDQLRRLKLAHADLLDHVATPAWASQA